ncbi:MAG: DUF1800 family protein [Pseudomonadota bacterium]
MRVHLKCYQALLLAMSVSILSACEGGGGNPVSDTPQPDSSEPPAAPVQPPVSPPPPAGVGDGAFATPQSTSRFLTQATFGPAPLEVSTLTGTSASQWFVNELSKTASLHVPQMEAYRSLFADPREDFPVIEPDVASYIFWKNTIDGNDQLRQRMAFALSQIFVISNQSDNILSDYAEGMAYYQDVLIQNALGNYRDLIEDVTYAPAMGFYLTYIGNQKADATIGRRPDENYAREILQLFSVGLVQLQPNGEPVLGADGQPVEIYDNSDITGLAKVFTGLDLVGIDRSVTPTLLNALADTAELERNFLMPMAVFESRHSPLAKDFLNCSIAAGTSTAQSIDLALDCIIAHPNVGPFVSRQLIQRFTTSDPSPNYVQRVAAAFDAGQFSLPDGTVVGDGRKGDLSATVAAILFDAEARGASSLTNTQFGKVREPLLRFTHWARAFDADATRPELGSTLYDLSGPTRLSQHPYRPRSVFNFYRPGYVAPGTTSGSLGMTVPELQIVNASTVTGYLNFLSFFTLDQKVNRPITELEGDVRSRLGKLSFTQSELLQSFTPDYTDEIAIANNASALVEHLDDLLAYDTLSAETKADIVAVLNAAPLQDPSSTSELKERVGLAIFMVMTSPDYLVQR